MTVLDFFKIYNLTFKFIGERYGKQALRDYWEYIAENYATDWVKLVSEKGTKGMEEYWSHSLSAEGAKYKLTTKPDEFIIEMEDCPAIRYLQEHNQDIYEDYCEHCKVLWGYVANKCGFDQEISYDQQAGRCFERYKKRTK